jgi:superfamily II DNA or RNA helicase
LTFQDSGVAYLLAKHQKQFRWKRDDPEGWEEHKNELKEKLQRCILFDDGVGPYTYSGLADQLAQALLCGMPVERPLMPPEPRGMVWAKEPEHEERYYQERAEKALLEATHGAISMGCHRKGEKVLMYDGSLRSVEDIVVGDRLMGPDSMPRVVEELKTGLDSMYELETVNGQIMRVNGNHLLVLRRTNRSNLGTGLKRRLPSYRGKNPQVILTVEDYLKKSKKFKHLYKMFSVGVDFRRRDVDVDPYFVGVLLGDGSTASSMVSVTTMDPEIVAGLEEQAKIWGLRLVKGAASLYSLVGSQGKPNLLAHKLWDMGVLRVACDQKRVPQKYLVNSRDVRLAILAGLIDTDGSLTGGCFDFISKSSGLSADVAYLSRSLGLRATVRSCRKKCQTGAVGTYYRVTISGDISVVPTRLPRKRATARKQKKDPTSFGFSVRKISDVEKFWGFVLDKDHRYLTDSFLVTHNTGLGKSRILLDLAHHLGLKTIIVAPSASILTQLIKDFSRYLGERYVGQYGDGKKKFDRLITIATFQSLTRLEPGDEAWEELSKCEVFMVDESHLCPAATLEKVCMGLARNAKYRFFVSATQVRGDGSGIVLKGIVGEIVYSMTVAEGVDQGFLAKPNFKMIRVVSDDPFESIDVTKMTRKHHYYNPKIIKTAADIANKAVAHLGHKVLIQVEEIAQFQHLLRHLEFDPRFAHGAAKSDPDLREKLPEKYWASDPAKLADQFNNEEFPILVGTSCISVGTDLRTPQTIINLMGGCSPIGIPQAVGRGTRRHTFLDGSRKTSFNFVDFVPMLRTSSFDDRPETSDEKASAHASPMYRHGLARAAMYDSLYPNVVWL